jgi:hypothetical protein
VTNLLKWAFFLFLILGILHYSFFFNEKNIYWSTINSIATILIFFVTFLYTNYTKSILEKTNKNAEYLIIKDINKQFNAPIFKKIYNIVLKNNVDLISEEDKENNDLFQLKKSTIKNIIIDSVEDIAIAIKLNLLTYSTIDRYHGYDILKLGSTKIVRDVLSYYRTLHNNSVYDGFIDLYDTIYYKYLPQKEWAQYEKPFIKRSKFYLIYIRSYNLFKFLTITL